MATQKITLTFPADLLVKLRERVPPRGLSRYVVEATAERLAAEERAALRENLKARALARAEEDLRIAGEFYGVEQEAYGLYVHDDEVYE